MKYEVENKFPISDLSATIQQLETLGADFQHIVEQVDTYFQHPVAAFAQTDECCGFDARQPEFYYLQGPKIDQATKTRREIELPLADGQQRVDEYTNLLEALGFRPVARVLASGDVQDICSGITGRLNWRLMKWTKWGGMWNWRLWSRNPNWLKLSGPFRIWRHLGLSQPERRSYLAMLLGMKTDPPLGAAIITSAFQRAGNRWLSVGMSDRLGTRARCAEWHVDGYQAVRNN